MARNKQMQPGRRPKARSKKKPGEAKSKEATRRAPKPLRNKITHQKGNLKIKSSDYDLKARKGDVQSHTKRQPTARQYNNYKSR